ncbi:serine/threonine-protein phosphatase 7 long form homolog [Raphanus sativus]|uniref:Serine/threonine-protein phosphatase 7 long form homolog n=1 Tax=Raphanus sativus TaxID=3726 RepID=A0A6J0JPS3_RAPSA|nr:serine/threonine-protein phosphatase 7 long form homolog [Raphanus sativus]XP_018437702.2 serine/threonine-protein phosphatase 7 long form homolog [Raphanus sativus]XP_056843587.1 serine/threonine-protein phosphatase 7 long form homolog [Raphanus sativus]XP_056843589.1 serine/threonine-protein phosphatase 7 long form homolog [Raphanus sativus]
MEVQSLISFDLDPGPVDQSVLVWQHEHRSAAIWEDEVPPRELTCRHKLLGMRDWPLEPLVCRKLIEFGLYGVYKVAFIQLDYALITALVERWRPETHTFHLPAGEITVTLQDVNILLGLRVDGPAVTGSTKNNWADLCEDLLGLRPGPGDLHGSHVSLAWLRDNFRNLPADPDEETLKCHTRAFILALMSGFLYGDKSKHDVALTFLPLLRDFDEVAKLSWGSATLALLYRELCRASKRTVSTICGPLVLLQLWAWERLHVGRPGRLKDVGASYMDGIDGALPDPLGCRWRASLSHKENPRGGLDFYRDQFDQQKDEQVIWQPYTQDLLAKLPLICLSGQNIWRTVAPLICFDVVEWHRPDRVLRQFGLHQTVPAPCDNEKALHSIDKRGKSVYDWSARHSRHIGLWEARESSVVLGEPECRPMDYNDPYMEWYRKITRRIISPMNERRPGQFLPTGFAFQVLVQRVAAIHARSKSSLEEELTVDTARQTLQDIVDMCAGALQLNAPLGSLSNGSVAQAPSSGPFLMLPQPTPTVMSQKPSSSDMVCLPLNEMGIDDGVLAEPSEGMPPVQDIGCEQSLPSVSQKPLFWPTGGKLTFSWICDVMLGFDWSSRNLPACEFSNVLPFNVLDELILSASKILRKEPNCVRIDSDKAKVVVVGDLHGQLHDLLFLMQDAGFPNGDQFYVFNGNYVDNGAWGLENFLLLLSWKVFLPDRVFLLRGSHESESCTSLYGFKNEVLTKYGDKGAVVYKKCLECFQLLPLASVIGGKVFTAHGGLFRDVPSFLSDKQERSRKRKRAQKNQADNSVLEAESRPESLLLGSLKDLFKVKRRVINPPADGSNLIPGDILWSDPSTDSGLFLNKEAGIGLLWGPDCTAKFLQDNDLKLIIRGKEAPHQRAQRDGLPPMNEGFSKDHEGLITLFSAPDHPQFQDTEERHNNKGAYIILHIPDCEEPEIHVFEAVSPRPKAEAYYDYRGLIHSTGNLVHNYTNSATVDSPFSAPDEKDSLISSENVEERSMDLPEAMEVDEVATFGTLASNDKDTVDSSEQTKDFSKEDDRSETAEVSKDLSDTVGELESRSREQSMFEATGSDEKLESRPPNVIDMEPPLAYDLHVLDSGESIESRTEKAANCEPMAVDEIAGDSGSRIGDQNDVEASNSTKISEEKAEKEGTTGEEEATRVDDCSTAGDASAELGITYDEKPESAVAEVTGNDTTDRNRDTATDVAEKSVRATSELNYTEPIEDMVDFNMEDIATNGGDYDPGTVNGGLNTDCTSLSKCLTSKRGGSEPAVDQDNFKKPSFDKDHGEHADKPERVIKLVTYSKRKSSDKKQLVDFSEDPQQKINQAVDSKTEVALDKPHLVPNMDS